ncbi:hypothetical protein KSF_064300 [Reticulibacter mediterranei]|uniref:Uncharacterized protein n=1 Tax=Reticulibacter mediterranei TaxID=2778369 RepID=A0A8J3N2W5_9CHLR|nr:hypothetical protein [Reticulibacter mediterranei]GHO96382.1 hypothetical protein KSF_064300 [Reticulibacter mediterranei]
MPFGMMLAARLARGAFSVGESGGIEGGIFSSQKSGKSFDVVRSTLVSDQPADPLDVSKSGFNATKGLSGKDTILSKSDSESVFGSESSSELFNRKSPSDHSLLGETGSITSRSSDGSIKATGETDSNDSKEDSKTSDKIKSKNSTWKRLMKGVSEYYYPTKFDGRILAMRGVDNGLGQQSNSIDAATTRVIRGDSSTSMNDFTDRPLNNQQNSIMSDMLMMHLFAKSQQKAREAENRELANTDNFNKEFNRRMDEEAAKLRENVSANTNATRHSESSRASDVTGHSESSRDSGKQDLTRRRGANR